MIEDPQDQPEPDDVSWTDQFVPFGRSRAILTITADDERLFSGSPAPVQVLIPVVIEE